MNKEKYFIDLSKCSEEQRKHIKSITKISEHYINYAPYLFFCNNWKKSHGGYVKRANLTELQYPEFIKLFEGGEEETSLQIALKALEDIINPIGYMKSQLNYGESLNGHYAIMISDKPKFYQDIAKEALEKINSKQ